MVDRVVLDNMVGVIPDPVVAVEEACPKWHARENADRELVLDPALGISVCYVLGAAAGLSCEW